MTQEDDTFWLWLIASLMFGFVVWSVTEPRPKPTPAVPISAAPIYYFNESLSEVDLGTLYNDGAGRGCDELGPLEEKLVSCWDMSQDLGPVNSPTHAPGAVQ